MKKIVYLLDSLDSVNLIKADVLLIAVKGLSTRSMFEHTLEEIKAIKANYSKEVFLLCDAVLWENDKVFLEEHIEQLLNVGDKILFSDLSFFMLAKEKGLLDKLIYYSPTLLVSLEEIKSFKKLGIDHFIISKECEYKGYKHILNNCKDVHLGMLALGYPQIYYSKRKMLTSFQKEYSVINLKCDNNYLIKEKTRDIFHPIFEDEKGTFIFAGEVFFCSKILKELLEYGMEYFIIDPTFINDKSNLVDVVNAGLNGIDDSNKIKEKISSFMLYREMVNNYEK